MTGDGTLSYGWDSRNRLVNLTDAAAASFAYDAAGRRSGKTTNGNTTNFAYDGVNAVQELAGGIPTASLLTGLGIDEVFSRTDSLGTRHVVTDALGSAVALTDGGGAVKTSYAYEPYGNTTASGEVSANAVQYTGRENDGTGLYYYRARYYHPGFGRFVDQDPIGLAGGPNVYAYAHGDPVNQIDPLGLTSIFFDAPNQTVTYYDGAGNQVASYPAGNNVTSSSNGPFPEGTWSYSYYNEHPESGPTGPYGSNGIWVFNVPGRSGMGFHSGRSGPQSKTLGCVRSTDDATGFLKNFTNQSRDPVTSITILR